LDKPDESPLSNVAYLSIGQDIFDKLTEFKREHGLLTWEQVFELLLNLSRGSEAEADGVTTKN
jgi:hypothetical protein